MIRKHLILAAAFAVALFGAGTPSHALDITMNVVYAPNVYGSPDWAPWWDAAKNDVKDGTFQNMRSGMYPGSQYMTPYEEIVYSTGDGGRRMHFIYWVPDTTIADLTGNFEVKWVIDWDGTDWTLDSGGAWTVDDPNTGWSEPSNWEEFMGGVIGSVGFAWWATDDDALPGDTGGSPYDEVDQADIDALAETVLEYQTYLTGLVRYREDPNSDWMMQTLTATFIPAPPAMAVFAAGIIGLAAVRRRRRKA
jgi:hypothetical protein